MRKQEKNVLGCIHGRQGASPMSQGNFLGFHVNNIFSRVHGNGRITFWVASTEGKVGPVSQGNVFGIACIHFQSGTRQREKNVWRSKHGRQQQRNADVAPYVRMMFSVSRARYMDITPV